MSNAPKRLTVLLVDDEAEILDVTAEILADEFDVRTASDGVSALGILQRDPIDIIISDQRMPGMSGIELLKESLTAAPDAERIVLTAYAELQLVIDCINLARVSHILTKPVKPEQILLTTRNSSEALRLRRENRKLLQSLQEHNQDLQRAVENRTSELSEANNALQHLQEAREQMIRITVHDLKNPLSNLRLALGALVQSDDRAEREEFNELANDSIKSMDALVSDLLSIAELERGSENLAHRETLQLADLVNASVQAFQSASSRKDIQLDLALPESMPYVHVNEARMREVFDNLISNAIKYTPSGGNVKVTGAVNNGSVEFEIKDNGLGMTEDDLQKAFGEFQRLSARPTNGESSTGLGLFIVKRILDMHAGEISIESQGRDQGTCFNISLPTANSTD